MKWRALWLSVCLLPCASSCRAQQDSTPPQRKTAEAPRPAISATSSHGQQDQGEEALAEEPFEMFAQGLLAQEPIGFRFLLRGKETANATYYLGPDWRERPMEIATQNDGKLVLRTQGGGQFRLQFFDKGKIVPDLLDSTDLRGIFDAPGGRSIPITISLTWGRSGNIGGRLYEDSGAANDEAFERTVRAFVAAVLTDRPDEAARFVSFPLRSDNCRLTIRNQAQLRGHWRTLFPPSFKKDLGKEVLHNMDMDSDSQQAFLLNGSLYFDKRGATLIRPPTCDARQKRESVRR